MPIDLWMGQSVTRLYFIQFGHRLLPSSSNLTFDSMSFLPSIFDLYKRSAVSNYQLSYDFKPSLKLAMSPDNVPDSSPDI
jgi:hypothetical protein